MRKTFLGVLATASLLLGAPMVHGASADAGDSLRGGCFFNAHMNAATNGSFIGKIGVEGYANDSASKPTGVSVDCQLYVGTSAVTPSGTFSASGTGLVVGQQDLSYPDPGDAILTMCERDTFADGDVDGSTTYSSTAAYCTPATALQVPPQVVYDTLNGVFINTIDPTLCPILKAHAGNYGPFTIESDGDVTGPDPLNLGLNPYDDCPPYRTV